MDLVLLSKVATLAELGLINFHFFIFSLTGISCAVYQTTACHLQVVPNLTRAIHP